KDADAAVGAAAATGCGSGVLSAAIARAVFSFSSPLSASDKDEAALSLVELTFAAIDARAAVSGTAATAGGGEVWPASVPAAKLDAFAGDDDEAIVVETETEEEAGVASLLSSAGFVSAAATKGAERQVLLQTTTVWKS